MPFESQNYCPHCPHCRALFSTENHFNSEAEKEKLHELWLWKLLLGPAKRVPLHYGLCRVCLKTGAQGARQHPKLVKNFEGKGWYCFLHQPQRLMGEEYD